MKKKLSNLITLVLSLPLFLSSCLGDSTATISPTDSLSYVSTLSTMPYTKYALSDQGLYITSNSSLFSSLYEGRFYFLKYHWTSDSPQTNSGNMVLYNVDDIGYGTSSTYPVSEQSSFSETNLTDFEGLSSSSEVRLKNFYPRFWAANKQFNDKWVLTYTVEAYEEDLEIDTYGNNNIKLNVVLQPSSQTNLGNNQALLSVYVTRNDANVAIDTTKPRKSYTGSMVVNLSALRLYFMGRMTDYSETNLAYAYSQFQYYRYDNDRFTLNTIGLAEGDPSSSGSNNYMMIIGGNQ